MRYVLEVKLRLSHWLYSRKSSFLLLPFAVILLGLFLTGCDTSKEKINPTKLSIGVVSYGEGTISLEKYDRFKNHIAEQTKSIVELEPAYNELQAVEQVQRQNWEIVFAPPGLAAIAISKAQYLPVFSMEGVSSTQRSLLLVRDDKPIQKIADLQNKIVALGETGSAAAFYVPLYDLYGLTLKQIQQVSTPKLALTSLNDGTVDAAAMAERDFEIYKRDFPGTKFRILHTSRWIPAGVVLIGPKIDRNQQQQIEKVMQEAPPDISADAGYLVNAKVPNYDQFIQLIEKVRPLEDKVKQVPVVLVNQQLNNQTIPNPEITKVEKN
ncbi:MAG: phosphate/phosphite/phosphonate ABC transporter substrate-binding protein [Calothrix sp. CSU_2_0]|nr:phosphate/phosphite/phosphonate ABC transporter substrate-binding protein [Calothrix sp. CSU_2_0]